MMTSSQTPKPGHAPFSLNIRVPPDPQFSRTVRSALESFAIHHHIAKADIEPLLYAVGEALANAIEHAGTHADLEVQAAIDTDRIVATVSDHGRGLPAIPTQHSPLPRTLAERGRGIPIMQRCTDIFEVTSTPGTGTSVRLGRFRSKRKDQPSAP